MSQNSQYVLAEQMVDAIHGVLGFHPTYRTLHAQGNIYRGKFRAVPEAKQYSRAVHLQGDPVPVTDLDQVAVAARPAGDAHAITPGTG